MAYASTSDVAALCPTLLEGEGNFSASTSPTSTQVEAWLSTGCGIIEGFLAGKGYEVPPASSTGAYAMLKHLNALYAAAMAEMALMTTAISPEERTRAEYLSNMFWGDLRRMTQTDLTMVGLSRSSYGALYAGGISESDKDTWEEDTDRVEPRFKRGQFAFPGTIRPPGTTAS